jgi:hypothetical protein
VRLPAITLDYVSPALGGPDRRGMEVAAPVDYVAGVSFNLGKLAAATA